MNEPTVCAVICSFNGRDLLLECLESLAAQTRPLTHVIIVDNASTDDTLAAVASSPQASTLDIGYIEMAENSGASGGFAEGVDEALSEGFDWLWMIDQDSMPEPEALARLLDSPKASDPETVALCSAMKGVRGHHQTEYRGLYRNGKPLPLGDEVYTQSAVRVDYAAFAGFLVRGETAARAGPPKAEFFIWVDDLEWCLRLSRYGNIWLIPESIVLHKDTNPQVPHGPFAHLTRSLRRQPDSQVWKHIYCFRNMSWIRKHYHREGLLGFAWHLSQHWFRVLMFDNRKLRRMRWYLEYGLAGRRGEFDNTPPYVWAQCASKPGGYEAVRRAARPSVPRRRLRGPFNPAASV